MKIFNALTIAVYVAWFVLLLNYPLQTIGSLLITVFMIVSMWKSDYRYVLLNALENGQAIPKSKGKREEEFNPPN